MRRIIPSGKSIKITYLITVTHFKRKWRLIVGGMLFLIVLGLAQWKFTLINFTENSVSEGLVGTYQQHDLPTEVMRLVSQGLVESDINGRIQPSLASGWSVNDEVTDYKFTLKQNVYWTDGSKVKSSDIDFVIPNADVSFPDDQTIEFKLKEPYSAFPSLLTKPVVKKNTLIGVGPYKITRVEKSKVFITKLILSSTKNNLPNVIVRFYPTEKTALTGFALGEVQSLLGVNVQNTNPAVVKSEMKTDYTKIVTVFFNTQDELLSNRSTRQALSFAVPQISGEVLADNPYSPYSWAYDKDAKDYLGKSDEAKQALERAKNNVSSQLLEKEVSLTTTPQLEDIGKKVVAAWREIGINAVLRVESGIPQKFQSLLITQSIPTDPDQYFLWHESQKTTNLTQYAQKRVDKDLEEGRHLKDESARKNSYVDFQRVLLEDAPAAFLYFPKYPIYYYQKADSRLNAVLPLQFSALYQN